MQQCKRPGVLTKQNKMKNAVVEKHKSLTLRYQAFMLYEIN